MGIVPSEVKHSMPERQPQIIGVSAQMQRVYGLIHQASAYAYPVLITGERGAGKTRAAQMIHSLSPRKGSAFVIADCSSVAPTLAESELFGYEKGAFAGAAHAQWGLFAFAREGTVLLREVGDLPLHVQSKFVAMLQEREFRPIGSSHPLPFNARVLATTSRDLRSDVERGNFREDLFFRLSAMQIRVAPLRERKEDIPLLIDYFLEKCEDGQSRSKFSDAAMRYLGDYDWPGNVGELEEAVRRADSLASGPTIEVSDVKLRPEPPDHRRWTAGITSYLDDRERQGITEALREAHGDKSAAARVLGIAESALQKRLQYYNLS
jgi:DNA-binding NtrC family response regulator